jgi:GT2 family glycosyltransferase
MEEIDNYKISILIVSRDRRNDLERLVNDLHDIKTSHSFEIVVVEETDHPIPIAGVKYVPHPMANRGIPYARNIALAHASHEVLVFLDDDCILHEGWLDNLVAPFQNKSILGVQGGVTVPASTNAIGWTESLLGVPGGGIDRVLRAKGKNEETIQISTLNCAYRKKVVDQVGGFEKSLKITGEDYILAKQVCKLGTCLFVPKAMVSHQARGGLIKIWHWFIRRGRAEIDVIRSGKQEMTTMWTVVRGSLLIKLLLLLLLCGMIPHLTGYFFLGAFLAYSFLQYMRCYGIWRNSRAPFMALALLPVTKLTMDVAMDFGRLRGLLFD